MTWLLIVAATAIGAGTAVALRWPVVGLLVYLWLDFMRPTDVFVELRFLHPMLVIGSATVAATLWQERTRLREGWRPLLPIAAVVAIVAVSVLISVDRSVSLRALIEVGKLLVLVWLMERLLRSDRPGVELVDGAVDRDPGLLVPGHDGALDGRRAPYFGWAKISSPASSGSSESTSARCASPPANSVVKSLRK